MKKMLMVGIAAATLLTPCALAQEVVIITATKTETDLQDTPISIAVIDSERSGECRIEKLYSSNLES